MPSGTRQVIKRKFLTLSWEQKESGHKDRDRKLIRIMFSVSVVFKLPLPMISDLLQVSV